MKIMNQSQNTVGEYRKVYIVDVTDKFNRKWSRIDGEINEYSSKVPLGKYKDNEQAKQVLKLLMDEPEIFTMPLEDFEDSDTFIYNLE